MSELSTSATDARKDPPTTFWRRFVYIGPSLILTATLIGSGELILTTTMGAELGFVALWMIIGTCVLKVAVQEALGRFTISTGKTTLAALDSLPGWRYRAGWGVWFWLIVTLSTTVQLAGIAVVAGEAVSLAVPSLDLGPRQWAPILCGLALAMLISGHYKLVESVSMLLVTIFSISVVICGVLIQRTPYAVTGSQLLEGFTFQLPAAGGKALAIVAAVGLSASELIYYSYWCLEKGYARFVGPREPTPEWEARAKGWIRVMQLDCYFAMVVYTATTIAFYLLGAAILHARGEVPAGMAVVRNLASMYTETLGPGAYFVFIGSAFLVLFSTLFVTIASAARLMPDCLQLLGVISLSSEKKRRNWVRVFVVFWAALYAIVSQVESEPIWMMVIGLAALALLLPMICFTSIYLRYRDVDRRIQPSKFLDSLAVGLRGADGGDHRASAGQLRGQGERDAGRFLWSVLR